MTELMLLRHGETTMGRGVYCGSSNPPLSAKGEKESRRAIRPVKAFAPDCVYTSDRLRAVQTAAIAAPDSKTTALAVLAEMDFGNFEGLNADDIQRCMPQDWQAYMDDYASFAFPAGESVSGFFQRAVSAVTDIVACHQDKRILIVSHKGVIMAALSHYLHGDTSHGFLYDVRLSGWATLSIADGYAMLKQLY